MCGRARCSRSSHAIAQSYGVAPRRVYGQAQYQPSHNLHPGNASPVVVRENGRAHAYHHQQQQGASAASETHPAFPPSSSSSSASKAAAGAAGKSEPPSGEAPAKGERSLVVMRWGLVPSWHKKGEKPDFFRAFNARSETVTVKPFFKRLVNARRCVVVYDGFYEWKLDAKGQKQPYFVHWEDGRPMAFAGLYDGWQDDKGEVLFTYTILTREPPEGWAWLHNRFPMVLPTPEDEERWLDTEAYAADDLLPKLQAVASLPGMTCHPCSKKMNNMAYAGEDASEPIKLEAEAGRPPGTTKTLHAFFPKASPSSSGGGSPTKPKAAATVLPSPPYHSPSATRAKKEEGGSDDDDDEVVILTPSAEEARGGGDVGKHVGAKAVGGKGSSSGGGSGSGKKRGAASPSPTAEKRHKAAAGFFPKSK